VDPEIIGIEPIRMLIGKELEIGEGGLFLKGYCGAMRMLA
jgi:hypothetical protein